jgi:hypothetical protein
MRLRYPVVPLCALSEKLDKVLGEASGRGSNDYLNKEPDSSSSREYDSMEETEPEVDGYNQGDAPERRTKAVGTRKTHPLIQQIIAKYPTTRDSSFSVSSSKLY